MVSLDFGGQDDLLALGVVPVGQRFWYGDDPLGTWPWAQDALGDATFELLEGEINIEQVAALDPDLILALYSGITAEEYALLSEVAPVVAPEARFDDYGTPWDVRALTVGRATGRLREAEAQVAAIDARLDQVAADYPEWQGLSAAVAFHWTDGPGAYTSADVRPQLLARLGFVNAPALEKGDGFSVPLSAEDLSPLDADLLLWIDDGEMLPRSQALAVRPTLRAHAEGREAYADPLLTGALSFSSLLSLPYALDRLVPMIEAAADGDPATPVAEAVAAGLAPTLAPTLVPALAPAE